MEQVYIKFAMRVMHWREKAGVFCGFTLLPSVTLKSSHALLLYLPTLSSGPPAINNNWSLRVLMKLDPGGM